MTKEERRYDLVKQFMGPIIYSGLTPKDAAAKGLAYADAALSALEDKPEKAIQSIKKPFLSCGDAAKGEVDNWVWYLKEGYEADGESIYELPEAIFKLLDGGTLVYRSRRYVTEEEAMDDFTRATRNLGES